MSLFNTMMIVMTNLNSWEVIVTSSGILFLFMSLSVIGRRSKIQKQSLKELLSEIDDDSAQEDIDTTSKLPESITKIENISKSTTKPRQSTKARVVKEPFTFESSPLRCYDEGDLFVAARGIKTSISSPIISQNTSTKTTTQIENLKSICIMVSSHAKILERLEKRICLLEEQARRSPIPERRRKHEPSNVQILKSPKNQTIRTASAITKSSTFNMMLAKHRIENAIRNADSELEYE